MTTNPIDTLAAVSTLRAMAELKQLAGFIHGVELVLADPAVAAECLRHIEAIMDPDDLSRHRANRDEVRAAVAEMRRVLS